MYNIIQRLGYSNCDEKGRLTLPAMMNLFQDISAYFGEDYAIGEAYLKENDLGWIVYDWEIEIISMPNIYEIKELTASTSIYEMKGSVSNRYYEISDDSGKVHIKAYATWVLIRKSTVHPVRLTDAIKNTAVEDLTNNKIEHKISKLSIPEGLSVSGELSFVVPSEYIDLRGHMNNARYVECISGFCDMDRLAGMRINYRQSALYKQELKVCRYDDDSNRYFKFFGKAADGEDNWQELCDIIIAFK